MTRDLRHERHSVTALLTHLVCVTKYRKPVLNGESLKLIEESFREVARKMDFQVLEFNGEANHVHAIVEYPPKLSVSQIVNSLKGFLVADMDRQDTPSHTKKLYGVLPTLPVR